MSSVWCSAAALYLYIRVNGGAIWCSHLYRVSFLRKRKLHSYRLVRPQKYMDSKTAIAVGVGAGAGALIAAVGAPLVLGAIGFTSAGIAAGSYAASMMSAAAVANGGGVVAGGVVASLQAAGAAGLSGAATAAVSGVGAAVGWLVSLIRGKEKS